MKQPGADARSSLPEVQDGGHGHLCSLHLWWTLQKGASQSDPAVQGNPQKLIRTPGLHSLFSTATGNRSTGITEPHVAPEPRVANLCPKSKVYLPQKRAVSLISKQDRATH